MTYAKKCPQCGAYLDPGERCDCGRQKTVMLYRYYNTDLDGKLRCEEIKARDTPGAYAWDPLNKTQARSSYMLTPKSEIDILPRDGYGEFWTLTRDDVAVRNRFLANLLQAQENEVTHVEISINRLNNRVVALGGNPIYPRFRLLGREDASC